MSEADHKALLELIVETFFSKGFDAYYLISAVKVYREHTGAGLKESKTVIDELIWKKDVSLVLSRPGAQRFDKFKAADEAVDSSKNSWAEYLAQRHLD